MALRRLARQQARIFDELPRFGLRNSKPLLESLLAKGRVLLLLDGLDEVAGERLELVNRAISTFLNDLDKAKTCRVLLTCREQNYDDLPDRDHYTREGFTEYRVAELREAEIREIVRRRQESFADKRKSMANYLEQVFRHSDILQLHRNPLLLTLSMGVYLHRPGEEVPHNLAQFYEQSIDNLLRRHDFREAVGSRSANRFKAECKFRLLRHFALQNLIAATEGNRDFEAFSFQAVTVAARQLAEEGKVAFKPDQARDVVKEIQLQAGLLNATRDNECFLFAHRSLNEYCAAAALNRQNEPGFKLIYGQLGNPAWRQVIFFYAAIDDDNDNAVQLVEAIKQRADEVTDFNLLALAGHCAAVMVQPRTPLRLELLNALMETLSATNLGTQEGLLLKSLLALGNSRDETIRQRLDNGMSYFIQWGNTDEFISEIGRLEPSVAIHFLGYLANSSNWFQKSSAVLGLGQIGSQNKIPLLWKLLLDWRAGYEMEKGLYKNIISQLLDLMAEPGGVDRLNACEPSPPIVDNSIREDVFKVYPFLTKDNPITNFILLLAWSVEYGLVANLRMQVNCDIEAWDAWQRFLGMVLIHKDDRELREWKRLPRDKNKWTGKVKTVVFGRLLFGTPLLLGFLLIVMMTFMSTSSATFQFSAFLVAWSLIFVIGLFISLPWLAWKHTLIQQKLFGTLDAFQEDFRRWLLPTDKPLVNGSAPMRMLDSIYPGLTRVFALGWAILLLGLAVLMNPSSIRVSDDNFNGLAIALDNSTVITDIVHIFYIWLALVFNVFFLPCLNWFDRGKVWYLRKPNRYIHLYQIPGVERWLPPEEK